MRIVTRRERIHDSQRIDSDELQNNYRQMGTHGKN